MAHINNKMLLIYGLTVFTFFVFFFVTKSPKDEIMLNYLKEIQIQKRMFEKLIETKQGPHRYRRIEKPQ